MQSWYLILLSIIPVLFAITVHEYAHGWTAKRYGDNTAYGEGRLTLNPLPHIDPIGTILVPLIGVMFSGFIFGWAKPVNVNFSKLNNFKKDGIKVVLAGPLSNFVMAIFWSLIMSFCFILNNFVNIPVIEGVMDMSLIGIKINILLTVFNLLPIPPLDGGRVLQFLLPQKYNEKLSFIEEYGMFIIMALAFTGVLSLILNPIVSRLEVFFLFLFPSILSLFFW